MNEGVIYLGYVGVLCGMMWSVGQASIKGNSECREAFSSYECGFEPMSGGGGVLFSVRFFFVSLVFLVFDLELVVLLPYVVSGSLGMGWSVRAGVAVFVVILVGGLYHEVNEGTMDWA